MLLALAVAVAAAVGGCGGDGGSSCGDGGGGFVRVVAASLSTSQAGLSVKVDVVLWSLQAIELAEHRAWLGEAGSGRLDCLSQGKSA